ncbi:hypothetical protein GTP58_30385 [Duganella sp. CY15W]|uniref:site-specific integrase n=1 Tax=Duganella sp. CY15W TaxID=2692172 RepID=UPI00136F85B3|nr:site-specific integrase [Duganella sp. CY15W]MYM32649.1 hypothetical protein [Duganella sp. CY15W]
MAIKLPSHLHRSRSGTLHFRIAIPSDVRHHFASREVYRALGTASVQDATDAAQSLSLAFREIRQQSMFDQEDKEYSPQTAKLMEMMKIKKVQLRYQAVIDELDAKVDQLELMSRRQTEQHRRELALVLQATNSHSAAGGAKLDPSSVARAVPMSAYIEPYFDAIPVEQTPNEKSLEAYRAAINTFIKIVGDKPLQQLGVQEQNRFEDVIVKLPANSTKLANLRSLSIDEMVALGLAPISPQSAKNIARRTNVFLEWAFRREGGKPPFKLLERIKLTKKRKVAATKRRAFTDDELRTVFDPNTLGVSNQPSLYMFWVPLIGAHTGMRINEIAQLNLADLEMHAGVHCFNVTDLPDPDEEAELVNVLAAKALKTEAARRLVPIHPRLVELGLLEYADALRGAGMTRLFPDLVGGRDGPGQPASKQFGRYCDRIGLTDPALVFQSFRHGAVGRMRSKMVPKELRKVVVGHSLLEDTHDGYGDMQNDYAAKDRYDAIAALNFDGIIDYNQLAAHTPDLAALNDSLSRQAKRKK